MQSTHEFIASQKDRFLAELLDLLRIPSISADPAYAGDVRKAAEWIAENLRNAGADHVRLEETPGYPIVYGEKMVDPAALMILRVGKAFTATVNVVGKAQSPTLGVKV